MYVTQPFFVALENKLKLFFGNSEGEKSNLENGS